MPVTILTKRSSVAGKTPASADIQVGELAVNTADARLYTKKSNGQVALLNRVDGPDDVYSGTTRYESEKIRRYYVTATSDANGRVTITPTSTGAASGAALFTSIISVQATAINTSTDANTFTFFNRETISSDLKTVTLRGARGTGTLLINTATMQFTGAGIQVYVEIIGLA